MDFLSAMVKLQIRSSELGYRYVVQDFDWCELWSGDHMQIAEFPGHLLLAVLLQVLTGADLAARFAKALADGEPSRWPLFSAASSQGLEPVPDRALPFKAREPEARPVTTGEKAALRLARRARKR